MRQEFSSIIWSQLELMCKSEQCWSGEQADSASSPRQVTAGVIDSSRQIVKVIQSSPLIVVDNEPVLAFKVAFQAANGRHG